MIVDLYAGYQPYSQRDFNKSKMAEGLEQRGFVVEAKAVTESQVKTEFYSDGTLSNTLRAKVFSGLEIRISRYRGWGWWKTLERLQDIQFGYNGELHALKGLCDSCYVVNRQVWGEIMPVFERFHDTMDEALKTLHQTFDWMENNL